MIGASWSPRCGVDRQACDPAIASRPRNRINRKKLPCRQIVRTVDFQQYGILKVRHTNSSPTLIWPSVQVSIMFVAINALFSSDIQISKANKDKTRQTPYHSHEFVRLRACCEEVSSDVGLIPAFLTPLRSPLAVLRTACLIVSIVSSPC